MSLPEPSPLIKATGTQELDVKGQILTAGPMSVELDNGNLRYIRLNGVEVLRVVAFLVRDENWGTYAPVLRDLSVQQHADRFVVSYKATCQRGAQTLDYEARIEGHADGSLNFRGGATPKTDFLTARTGFVVLHPLEGVVDKPLKVEHVDGTVTDSRFPAHVNPDCPFRNVRALSHEALPGVWLRCEMLGDAFEMEDHRNWTDASFKTYVRPLALPWPYTLPAGEKVEQSVTLTLSGALPAAAKGAMSATGPKQETTVRPVLEDQRTVARARGTGRADGLTEQIKAARVVLGQRSTQSRELSVGFQSPEARLRFQHAGRRPSQSHRGVAPMLHVPCDAADRALHVLDRVGAGQ